MRIRQRLVADLRENRDVCRVYELRALCLAALSGNGQIDAVKSNEQINGMIEKSVLSRLPYTANRKKEPDRGKYDAYFKMLDDYEREASATSDRCESDSP